MPSERKPRAPGEALITCERLVVGYSGRPILPPIDVVIRPGSLLAVIGRNGSGKTTWLRTVLGLIPPVSGRVLRAPDLRFAYVPQATQLDDAAPVRVIDLVGWGRLSRWSFLKPFGSATDRAACLRALEGCGAAELAKRRYRDLSQGQKQRVLFARMLAHEAQVALLDEPTAAMDVLAEREAVLHLVEHVREDGLAAILVAHDLDVTGEFADEVLYLDRDEGSVVTGPTATVFAHPQFRHRYGEIRVHERKVAHAPA